MAARDEVVAANERYAARFTKGDLAMPPARRFAIVTCMDARIDPAKAFGLEEGDAHVIRNAGGLATEDAIRSIVISHWLLGTEEFLVVGHTDCGMLTFTNDVLRAKLADEAGADASGVDFRPFSDLEASVRSSVAAVRDPDEEAAAARSDELDRLACCHNVHNPDPSGQPRCANAARAGAH